jgi:hypothetical protein
VVRAAAPTAPGATEAGPTRVGAEVRYRARPYVCGAIGAWDADAMARLRAGSPPGLREVHTGPAAVLWATDTLGRWDGGRGFTWAELAEGPPPSSWTEAAERRLAAGLHVGPSGPVLHTDALALQDVYLRRLGGALYFSVRVDPLVHLDDAPLHIDWSAWGDILALSGPLDDRTPFAEVRRLVAATAWRAGPAGLQLLRFEPSWMGVEPTGTVTAGGAVDVVAGAIGRVRPMDVPLSGGWDSRLLAILARRAHRRVVTWTTSKDDGYDRDVEYASPVARALGVAHNVVVTGPEAWLEEHPAVRRRLDFQTNHHVWMMPLIRRLHARPGQVLDGLAGDILFKGSAFIRPEIARESDPARRRRLMWIGLAQNRLRRHHLLAPGVAAAFEARCVEAFERAVGRLSGHPHEGTLTALHTRAARAIACCPLSLVGPEARVRLPFLHPDVVTTALSIPVADKSDGAFYRAMMAAADPAVAGLPSTNDGRGLGRRGAKRQTSSAALAALADGIRGDEVAARILSPEMRAALRDPAALELIGSSWGGLYVLQWASLLADWRRAYASRLADGRFEID